MAAASDAGALCLRGTIVDTVPGRTPPEDELRVIDDGAVIVDGGRIAAVGPAAEVLRDDCSALPVHDHRGRLIVPGFVDSHIHFAQTDIIASYGEDLLSWLHRYTFPIEAGFGDGERARETAEFFLAELLRNGTTTANVMATVHPESVNAIFAAARRRGMRLIAGKVLMDRHCPAPLQDTASTGYRDSRALLERWHGCDRLGYAVAPRFAPTSSPAQLQAAGRLVAEFPEVHLHTHLAEHQREVAWVRELFPAARSYLDVYDAAGLLGERSIFAHCIHLEDADWTRLAAAGGRIAFAPTANLFLGSGLFDYGRAREASVPVGLGTDVGAGTSFSLLRTGAEAHKVAALNGRPLPGPTLLDLATRAGAEALGLSDRIGAIAPGMEADLVVLDPSATPLTRRRTQDATPSETLFALFTLGDDRHVASTYVAGRCCHSVTPTGMPLTAAPGF